MFGWIPIIGPIIDGIFGIFNKFQDVKIVKLKTGAQVDIASFEASTRIIEATKDSIGVRLARDIIIFPVSIWTALISWDTIMALRYPNLMWHVADYPNNISYLPLAVIAFLLGNIGINILRRFV